MLWILRFIFGKKIGMWLLDSVTDDKKQASARRLSAAYLMMLYGIAHISYLWIMHNSDNETRVALATHLVWMMGVDVVGALFYFGLVTVQNIQMGLETIKGQQHTETVKETESAVIKEKTTEKSSPAAGGGENLEGGV